MRAVDTNVLVRLFVGDNEEQTRLAEAFVGGGAWVSHLALVETVWVLESAYGLSRAETADLVASLLTHKDLVLQESEIISAALVKVRQFPSLGFSDCMILEIARRAGHYPLGTFDRNLSRKTDAQLIT